MVSFPWKGGRSSERPAFCLVYVFDKNNSDMPPCYAYNAQVVVQQHDDVSTLLIRCRTIDMLAAGLAVATSVRHIKIRPWQIFINLP